MPKRALFVGVVATCLVFLWMRRCGAPPAATIRQFSQDRIGDILADLHHGNEVRIERVMAESVVEAQADVSRHASDSPVVINQLRGFGRLPEFVKRRLVAIYQEVIEDLILRVQSPRDGASLADVLSQASDLALLEEFRAKLDVVTSGSAFFAEYKVLPEWDGWMIMAEQNQTLVVDREGFPVDEPSQFTGDRGDLSSRKLPVLVPIELAKYPALVGALSYRRDLEVAATQERVDRFNEQPFEVRRARYDEHIRARTAISALGGSQIKNQQAVDNLAPHLLNVPFVDSKTYVARMKRE